METPKFEQKSAEEKDGNKDLIESRIGFSSAAREVLVQSIFSYIEKEGKEERVVNEEEIAAKIYNYLTRRKTVDELHVLDKKFSPEKHQTYIQSVEDTMRELIKDGTFKMKGKSSGSPWSHVWYENKFAMQTKNLRVSEQESVDVMPKQYFTFVPVLRTIEGVSGEMNAFIKIIPELINELRLLGLNNTDEIELKVPNNILFFISHPDSMVVHFRNERIADDVRRIVQEVCARHGIAIARKGRAETGFDFRSSKGKYAHLSGSHSELIAKAIAKNISRDIKRNGTFAISEPKAFLEWFDGEVDAKGKLSPENMLKHLVD